MEILLVCLISIALLYLLYKFARYAFALYIVLCCGVLISFPIMLFDMDLAARVLGWSAALLIFSFALVFIAAIVGGFIGIFVVAPIAGIWYGIKTVLSSIFK